MSPLEDYQVDRLAVQGRQLSQLTSTNGQTLDHFNFDHNQLAERIEIEMSQQVHNASHSKSVTEQHASNCHFYTTLTFHRVSVGFR